MSHFPIFYPYPIEEKLYQSPFDNIENIKKLEIITNDIGMLIHSFKNYNGSSIKSIFNDQFKSIRSEMLRHGKIPHFKDIPAATKYQRNENFLKSDLSSEIKKFGLHLSPDQTIFHGGDFTKEDLPSFSNYPISTTFNPTIAIWHAYNDGNGKWDSKITEKPAAPKNPAILIINVSIKLKKKAIIFRRGGPSMADEMEALFDVGCKIIPIHSFFYMGYMKVKIIIANLEGTDY